MTAPAAPRTCFYIPYGQFDDTGYIPSVVTEGEPGHTPLAGNGRCAEAWHWGTYEQAKAMCVTMNERLGISATEALGIVCSSMNAGPPAPAAGRFRAILGQLPLAPQPGLYLEPQADGTFLVMQEPGADDEEGAGDAIAGLAILDDGTGGWYLGCQSCRGEIGEADAGMCVSCRQDLDFAAAQHQQAG